MTFATIPVTSKYDHDLRVDWYRTPVSPALLDRLNERSDVRGFAQAGGYLSLIIATGVLAIGIAPRLGAVWLLAALFLHGTCCAFMTNAAHELVHGTVFRTAGLNTLFLRVFAFLRWFPHHYYWASHTEHHKFTLHPPQDQEVLLPTRFTVVEFVRTGCVDPVRLLEMLATNLRWARGRLRGDWEHYVLGQDPVRFEAFRWARILLLGHGAIAVVSIYHGNWLVPLVVSLTPCYGGWLLYLCNNTQHAGLRDKVADFRLNCRTMKLNPVLSFLYWHMNYHTEHHMYAGVPCYNLRRLHEAIKNDLPPVPSGLWETWAQIADIQRRQRLDPTYQYDPPLPAADASRSTTAPRHKPPPLPAPGERRGGDDQPDRVWECSVCGFVYSERQGLPHEGIAPGTAWDDIPADWRCPDCGTSKPAFHMVEISTP